MDSELSACVAYALTGERMPLGEAHDPASLIRCLELAGWSAERMRQYAQERLASGCSWPHGLGPEDFTHVSAARWYATLQAVRAQLGLDVDPQPPSQLRPLTTSEQRLVDDSPPHHGPLG